MSQLWDLKSLAFRRPLSVRKEMEHYRRTSHTRFDMKYHFVSITKYRKKLLQADVGVRLRQIVRDIYWSSRLRSSRGTSARTTCICSYRAHRMFLRAM